MREIIEAYRKWRNEHNIDYCYDEIYSFIDENTTRVKLFDFMEATMKMYEKTEEYKPVIYTPTNKE